MHRRTFLRTGLFALAATRAHAATRVPIATAFDEEMEKFMQARGVPGGALAVIKDRRLVYAKGYGMADREKGIAATADSLFRIASISKSITGVAILQLVEGGRLDLDARAFDLLGTAPAADPRIAQITIRQLLHHTAGWDRDKSGDPMFRSARIVEKLGVPAPAQPAGVIGYMLGQPLDFDPGTRYWYSNFGYCVLGRIIEKITGQGYEQHVREKLLAPIGISKMRIGSSLDTAPGEVRYYASGSAKSVFPSADQVPWPYGGFHLEAMDAHGGWIASAVDLVRFAAALDDPARSPVLKPDTFAKLHAPPEPPVSRKPGGTLADSYYGCGWSVRPVGTAGKANYWHNGSLPGTSTLLVRRWDGLSWAALFNQRSEDNALPDGAIDGALHRAADRVEAWPEGSALI